MTGADIGSAKQAPLDVVVELVEVSHDLVEAQGEVSSDVLKYGEGRAQYRQSVADVGPQVPLVILPLAAAGHAERLARVPAGDDVDAGHGGPVDGGDVAQVGGVGESVREHLAGAGVDLGHPRGAGAESFLDGHIERAETGK